MLCQILHFLYIQLLLEPENSIFGLAGFQSPPFLKRIKLMLSNATLSSLLLAIIEAEAACSASSVFNFTPHVSYLSFFAGRRL